LKPLREEQRLKAIKQGLIPDPSKPMRLDQATDFEGTCEEMCPEWEREEREYQNNVDPLERVRDKFFLINIRYSGGTFRTVSRHFTNRSISCSQSLSSTCSRKRPTPPRGRSTPSNPLQNSRLPLSHPSPSTRSRDYTSFRSR